MAERPFKTRRQPETLRVRELMPCLTVGNLEASIAWYTDVLGCTLVERHRNEDRTVAATLVAGIARILLAQDDWAQGRDRTKGVGFRLHCTTRQDVDQLAEEIRAHGGTLASEPTDQPWGGRDFTVVDLDGFKITVSGGMD